MTYLALPRGESRDTDLVPRFVERELRRYLECAILACGFARAKCSECGHDFLIALPDGETQLRLTPRELLDRLAVRIPPPRVHRRSSHGVLAPNAPWRTQVTAMAADSAAQALPEAPVCRRQAARRSASQRRCTDRMPPPCGRRLPARIYEVIPLACPHCGGSDADHRLRHRYGLGRPHALAPRGADPGAARRPRARTNGRHPLRGPGIRPRSHRADAGLRIRPDPALVRSCNGACPQRERQRLRSSPGKPQRNPQLPSLGRLGGPSEVKRTLTAARPGPMFR